MRGSTRALHGALLANLVALDWPLEFYPDMSLSRGEAAVMMYLTLAYQGQASLDNPILKQETVPGSGEYVFRHIRMAGEPNFSFGPPTINVNVIPSYSDTWVQSAGNRGVNGRRLIDF